MASQGYFLLESDTYDTENSFIPKVIMYRLLQKKHKKMVQHYSKSKVEALSYKCVFCKL